MNHKPVGLTEDVGWEIGVSRTLQVPIEHLWEFLISSDGVALWLGALDGELPRTAGESGSTTDGTSFEIRSFRPGDRLRLVIQPADQGYQSTFQFTVRAAGPDKTTLRFHQERLAGQKDRERQRLYWRAVMDQIQDRL